MPAVYIILAIFLLCPLVGANKFRENWVFVHFFSTCNVMLVVEWV